MADKEIEMMEKIYNVLLEYSSTPTAAMRVIDYLGARITYEGLPPKILSGEIKKPEMPMQTLNMTTLYGTEGFYEN